MAPTSFAGRSAPAVSVVIPVHAEAGNLETLDRELRDVLDRAPWEAEILYIDDGSGDGSDVVLDGLVASATDSVPTTVIHLSRRYGQTLAMAAGFELARGTVVVPMDGDLQNDPAEIPRLVEKLDEGFDVVSGWRRQRRDRRWSRRLPSRIASWLIGRLTGVRLHDFGCTQKAYRGELLRQLRLYGEMHRFLPAYFASLGARVTELEVGHRERTSGQSKYGLGRTFKVFLDLFFLVFVSRYLSRPMHFFGQAGLLFLSLFCVASFFMVVFKFGWLRLIGIDYQVSFIQTPLPGLAATFFLGGILSIFLGVIGELLARLFYEARDQRPYSIRGVVRSEPPGDPVAVKT